MMKIKHKHYYVFNQNPIQCSTSESILTRKKSFDIRNKVDQANSEENKKIKLALLDFLRKHKTAVLALSTLEGKPHAATIYYTIEDDFSIYFFTSSSSIKSQYLAANNSVALVVGTGPDIVSAQIWGIASPVSGDQSHHYNELMRKLNLKELYRWPLSTLKPFSVTVYMIKPTKIAWLNLDKDNYPELYKEGFYEINF